MNHNIIVRTEIIPIPSLPPNLSMKFIIRNSFDPTRFRRKSGYKDILKRKAKSMIRFYTLSSIFLRFQYQKESVENRNIYLYIEIWNLKRLLVYALGSRSR